MKKKNNTAKYCNIVIIFTLIMLILFSFSISFAWYQAKIANSIVQDLNTAGIKIDFNTKDENTLTPDILKEGVLNNTQKLPDDYNTRKASGDTYYVESFGNSVKLTEDVKVIFGTYIENDTEKVYTNAHFYISMKYLDKDGKVKDLDNFNKYFDIDYALVSKGDSEYTLNDYNDSFFTETSGDYDLHLQVSYRLPDELLPVELVNSSCITIYIVAELS